MWFTALVWITLVGAVAATWENLALTAVLGTLTLGAGFTAVAEFVGSPVGQGWALLGGWTFIVSAVCAWYTGSALMLEGVAGRPVLPVGDPARTTGAGGRARRRRARSRQRPVTIC